ncbi:hypothetical protein CY34DRAFT_97519, partial [Suillus luteus UH-Slu-Lm8-n1]
SILQPTQTPEEAAKEFDLDITCILAIRHFRYLRERPPMLKAGSLQLAWEYAQNTAHHSCFINMLRVLPKVFYVILGLIEDHPVFQNHSNHPQAPVQIQLAVTLYRMGRYGNGASIQDIARFAGISEGAEKEYEKQWIDSHVGFRGLWRNGWVMYDGTIVVLFAKPWIDGDAYYTRKSNYGLNLQVISNFPLALIITLTLTLYIDWKPAIQSSNC